MEQAKRTWADGWIQTAKTVWIGGESQTGGGKTFTIENPTNETKLLDYRCASSAQVDAAVDAAGQCLKTGAWHQRSMRQRADLMRAIGAAVRRHQAELATLETMCNG